MLRHSFDARCFLDTIPDILENRRPPWLIDFRTRLRIRVTSFTAGIRREKGDSKRNNAGNLFFWINSRRFFSLVLQNEINAGIISELLPELLPERY